MLGFGNNLLDIQKYKKILIYKNIIDKQNSKNEIENKSQKIKRKIN